MDDELKWRKAVVEDFKEVRERMRNLEAGMIVCLLGCLMVIFFLVKYVKV